MPSVRNFFAFSSKHLFTKLKFPNRSPRRGFADTVKECATRAITHRASR
jgi:hypothetical protein